MATDSENLGGEGGGLDQNIERIILKRSELAVLRRMADKYPITPGERQEVLDKMMDVVRRAKSFRSQIAAVKTIAALDKVNHDELKILLESQRQDSKSLEPAAVVVNNNVTNTSTVVVAGTPEDKFLERATAYNSVFAELAGGRDGLPVDPPSTLAETNGVHVDRGT